MKGCNTVFTHIWSDRFECAQIRLSSIIGWNFTEKATFINEIYYYQKLVLMNEYHQQIQQLFHSKTH